MKNIYRSTILFVLVYIISSCNNSAQNNGEIKSVKDTAKVASKDTVKVVAQNDTILKQQPFSFSIARNGIEVHMDDFDKMMERRVIRVLVPYSRTLYFNDKGRERGFTAETVREFESYLNKKYRKELKKHPITVVIIATPRDQLITNVSLGFGDIAAGNLTETEKRSEKVDFISPPELQTISEIILTRKQDAPITSVEDLAGKTVHVRTSSSYYESLQTLNKMFAEKGKPPIKIVPISELLEDEDLMEMLNAGIIHTIVADDWKAKMWAPILANIKVNENVSIRKSGNVGWALRKNSPLLFGELKEFYYKNLRKNGAIEYRFVKYNSQIKQLQNPTKQKSWMRYQETINMFTKYGEKYDFDPLMLAALGFQESQLNQEARSSVGAVGVMQLMPKTGAEMKVGEITIKESNIHAGTKYMKILMSKYFQDAHFDNFNRCLFAFASYNAGPGRISRLRELAAKRGLNPDVWLKNVEIVVGEKVGWETTTYVRNIVKYYFAYRLMLEIQEQQQKVRGGI